MTELELLSAWLQTFPMWDTDTQIDLTRLRMSRRDGKGTKRF